MNLSECSSDDSTDEEETIRNFDKEAQAVISQKIIPSKSVNRYNLVYETFIKWKDDNKANSFEECILICYFTDLQKKVGPNTLWSVWSMLKKMLNMKHNIDIDRYLNLKAILKNNSKGHKAKKSLALTWDQIMLFMKNADDYIYLSAKILLIFGICGALRCIEFINMKYTHVEDKIDKFIVLVQDTKTYIDRSFVIGSLFYSEVKKYISLRPPDNFTDRFFIQYMNGRCCRQVMGKNKIGSTPSMIASFLGLQDSSRYTGHCYRRTSATLLSNSGANMTMIKQLGGWKSDAVAAGYVADSTRTKDLIFQGIINEDKSNNTDALLAVPSTSKHNKTDALLTLPSTSRNNKTDDCLVTPSTSKENSLNNDENKIDEVTKLHLTYEDFCDSMDQSNDQVIIEVDPSVHFSTANGKQLPLQTSRNASNILRKRFTEKPPVNLSFTGPKKKLKIQESASSSATVNNNNVQPILSKDSNVLFENCTINGNITNNYYYQRTEDSKENNS